MMVISKARNAKIQICIGLNSHGYFLQKVTRNQGLLNETGHESFINIHSQNYLVNYSPFSCVGKMSITHFINTGNLNASFVNKLLTEELTWQTMQFQNCHYNSKTIQKKITQ